MTKQPTLRQLFQIGCHNAKRLFLERGEVTPMWHAVPEDGEHLLIATPWEDDDEKVIAIEYLRHKFKKLKVLRFVFIVEAWVVQMPEQVATNEAGPPWPRPSEHPDRREVVKIQAEDRDGSALSGMYYILRPEHGPATLSPFHEDQFTSVAGRLTGLLVGTRR